MRQWLLSVVLLSGSLACGFDTSGAGSDSGAVVASDGGDSTTAASSGDGDPTAPDGTGSGDGSTSGVSGMETGPDPTTTNADESDESDSTGSMVDPCANPALTVQMDADQASLVPPMMLDSISGVGPYAYSESSSGEARFSFNVECQAEFRVYARIYDAGVGLSSGIDHADSFQVAFDEDSPQDWLYGCQTFDAEVGGHAWEWEPVKVHLSCVIEDDFRRTLSPGPHMLRVISRESGDHQQGFGTDIGTVAAVASVVITSDPGYSPP